MGDINRSLSLPYRDDTHASEKEYAESLDAQDPLHHLREQFIIPSKEDLRRKTLTEPEGGTPMSENNETWPSLA